MEGRIFTVHLNDSISTPKSIPSGLPQGAVLSTTPFSLYLSDIPPLAHPPRLIRRWQCPSISVLATRYYIPQTQKLKPYYFPRAAIPPLPDPIQIQDTFVPWTSTVRYLGLVLHSKLLFTRHLHTVANKATGVFCNIFPFLARDSAFTQSNNLALNKLLIRFILIYASPVSSSTCSPTTTDFK